MRRADDRADVAVAALADPRRAPPLERAPHLHVEGLAFAGARSALALELLRRRVACPREDEDAAALRAPHLQEGLDAVESEIGIERHGVGRGAVVRGEV